MSEHTYDWLKRQVDDIAEERLVQLDRAFAAWCIHYVHREMDIDEAFIRTDTLRGYGGGDGGLDGWYKDESEKEFHLWQCKWAESYGKNFSKQPAIELKNALEELLDLERANQYGDKFLEVASKLKFALEQEYKIVLNVGIAGSMGEEAQVQFRNSIHSFAREKLIRIDWELWDLNSFQQEYEEHHPSSEALEGKSYEFSLQSPSVIHMASDDPTLPKGWEVIVASLQGMSLGHLAQNLGSKLFSLNVRFALGSNKRIKNIWESLVDPIDSQYFWLYNNGLTILCDDFELKETKKLSITNPQIVNGCQTVTAFRKKLGLYSKQPSVLARIIKAPSNDEGKKQAILIAEKTNSQNPVLSRDLRSNDAVQAKLRKAFEQLDPPWFYERKRGEWGTLSNPERSKFKETNGSIAYRRLDMEYVGQSWRMLSGKPAESLTQKRDLFDDDDIYSNVFHPRREPEQLLFAAQIRTKYEEFWHGNNFEGIRRTCGIYLTDSVLKRLINAKGQIVSHSVALSCRAIKKGEKWELKDARIGLKVINNFDTRMKVWNRLLAKALHEMLQAIDNDDNSLGFKRTLEKSGGEALEQLWESIEASASILLLDSSSEKSSVRDILVGEDS